MSSTRAREQLLELLATNSFRLGEFTLSSGAKSDYYIDCRTTTLHAHGAELTGRVFLDLIQQQAWQPQAVGGLTMGADPIAFACNRIGSIDANATDDRGPALRSILAFDRVAAAGPRRR